MDIEGYWRAVLRQDADGIRKFFSPDAHVSWHCTGERFTVAEFIRVNCEYPGKWDGEIERIEQAGDLVITAVRVFSRDGGASFHAVSFIRLAEDKIAAIDEYWGDDGAAPQWRLEKHIGAPIRQSDRKNIT